ALEQRPLRETVTASTGIGESFAAPRPTDSLAEASRAMSVMIGREGRRELVAQLVERAGIDLSPAAAWLIVRLAEADSAHPASIPALCGSFDIPLEVGQRAMRELDERGLLLRDPTAGEDRGRVVGVTAEGQLIAHRLVEERRATLARVCSGWQPEDNEELTGLLTRLARELAPDEDRVGAAA
ncbi:MAG: hypothetical protein ACXVFO_21210, partial [Solirubrobacteraceae bacterium]